jgi:hypothetical protein
MYALLAVVQLGCALSGVCMEEIVFVGCFTCKIVINKVRVPMENVRRRTKKFCKRVWGIERGIEVINSDNHVVCTGCYFKARTRKKITKAREKTSSRSKPASVRPI